MATGDGRGRICLAPFNSSSPKTPSQYGSDKGPLIIHKDLGDLSYINRPIKKLTGLQHRVRAIKSRIQNRTNLFFWDNVIEQSHCTYNPLDVISFNVIAATKLPEGRTICFQCHINRVVQ